MMLPGGRYSCAQALVARDLSFLHGCSLGQVCHIVQLAISQRKLLGYANGAVVPYRYSESMKKDQCAMWQQPLGNVADVGVSATGGLPLACWETARSCLHKLLEESVGSDVKGHGDGVPSGCGPGALPLSNVKRLFRSRFQVELSETALGYTKLSELLADVRFRDVCTVQLRD